MRMIEATDCRTKVINEGEAVVGSKSYRECGRINTKIISVQLKSKHLIYKSVFVQYL